MNKVGLVTTPLSSGHAVRGVGFYTRRLLANLVPLAAKFDIQIVEIKSPSTTPQIDLIHYPFFDLFYHTLPLVRETKTIVTVHDVIPLEFPEQYPLGMKGWIKLLAQRTALNNVDIVLTDSYASIKSINKYLGVPHSKLRLVYLAPDKKFRLIGNKKILSSVSKKYKLPYKFVLYVGDVNWSKNILGLVEASRLAGLSLVIVGKQAMELNKLIMDVPRGPRDMIRELFNFQHPQLGHLLELERKLNKQNVHRLGFISDEDLAVIYNLAYVYCQPSFAEGFGLGVLEAMACGTAVACSNTHSLPEIAGNAATYFDPTNTDEMAKALLKGPTGKEISQAGKFSWTKTAEETLMAYQEVLKQ